jgi:hypothetical protein
MPPPKVDELMALFGNPAVGLKKQALFRGH